MIRPIAAFILSALFTSCVFFAECHAQQSAAPPAERPNVLFISVDDLNDWTGYLGGHPQAQTPNLDRLAQSGVAFTHAYAPSPVCGPSRTALLYGRYPHETGAYGNNDFSSPQVLHHRSKMLRRHSSSAHGDSTVLPVIFDEQESLPTVFSENGYYTAGAGKISHFTQTPRFPPDIASFFKDDFDLYFDPDGPEVGPDPDHPASNTERLPFGPVTSTDEKRLFDTQFADWAVQQLQKDYDKPFFLAVGFVKPHLPWVAPQPYFDQFVLDEIQLPKAPEDDLEDVPHAGKIFAQSLFFFRTMYPVSDHQYITEHNLWRRMVRAYLASTSYVDAMVGRILDALAASPYAENTIVVLWGDHGWHLGEKKHWRKMTLWETGTQTPLIIRVPGSPSNGASVDASVSLLDLFPTLVDLCDLETDQPLDGNSLTPLLEDPDRTWNEPVLMALGPGNFAVRLGPWRYIRYQNGDEELYNIEEDPGEFNNLAGEPEYERVIERLGQYIPTDYVVWYNDAAAQFKNLDTMEVFIE